MLGRSLQMLLKKPTGLKMATSMQRVNFNQITAVQHRQFAKKRTGRARKNQGETTDAEAEPEAPVEAAPVEAAPVEAATPAAEAATEEEGWSVGDITQTQSVPNNKPPS